MTLVETMKALGRPVKTASELIENLLGEPFKIAGDALSDQVRMWQCQNRLRIAVKVKGFGRPVSELPALGHSAVRS